MSLVFKIYATKPPRSSLQLIFERASTTRYLLELSDATPNQRQVTEKNSSAQNNENFFDMKT
ncbi:uncharacterized protein PHALS_15366 [Plasmopara halstedii]|uniref:Uncharacterized protein n=1 Tax=Plasmopara halstedii TaxID=4781 RepID=A0A0P1AF92_PLAHL|nr:uncharacterized protein PHALS_15366 [Plasmopara halstedii]CEG39249.1 hypothetical protein PHALS_15366 [Plasmopara halstedii]|eukprot:XP_024575618.1 hypothetical protein PHALS_15366 [Plasmopara halstedii]